MIYAVDFDGTIQLADKSPNKKLISTLTHDQRNGAVVILWTCRTGESLKRAVAFCMKNRLKPDLINENHPATIARLGCNPRKVYADIYIDDKGGRPW